ncbi:MAG: phosphoesterase RecJ-like protein [Sulfurimonas sp.]|jgi:phosphoesterase RecJ-like protein|uniref:DHH family phosphoesterase n=1 Tax=Sulfurimonas sp. TaxID=2022749 RepID=UPI0039E6BEF0
MKDIIKRIDSAKHIVVIAHINPDADSLGSASAMYTYILTLHKKVSLFCVSKNINPKLSFLPWADKVRNSFPASGDLAIALDCGSIARLGIDIECDLVNIDHHQSNPKYGEYNLVDTKCISTSQILCNFFLENEIPINKKMATSLYAGLLDDSDGFMSDDVDGTVLATSKMLIESGAEYKLCNKYIMKYQSLASLRLKAIMLGNMSLFNDARIALFLVSNEDMKKTGAIGEDCEGALEESLHLPTVEVAVLLKENKDLSLKGSLRTCGNIDASKIASKYSGGGHKSRAGFTMRSTCTLEDASQEILKLLNKEI